VRGRRIGLLFDAGGRAERHRSGRIGAVLDAARLVWPITGGYRLVAPVLMKRSWKPLRRVSSKYRRTLLPRTTVIAVVGSVGKTTTRQTVATALGGRLPRHGRGNYNSGVASNLLAIRPWHRNAVLEVGIGGPGKMAQFAKLVLPDMVVVTAIASDHNRSMPTLEITRAEKAKMVEAVRPDGVVVLNGDDPNVMWMATRTAARVVTYGLGEGCDVRATDVQVTLDGTEFVVHVGGASRRVRSGLLGRHLVYPALAAIAVALERGERLDDVVARLADARPAERRMEPVALPNGATLLEDAFKGSLETVHAALDAFRDMPARRHVVVLGDLEEVPSNRREHLRAIGRRLAPWADRVVLIGHKDHKTLVAAAVAAGAERQRFTYLGTSVHDAIALLRDELGPGDAVLVKGGGARRMERIGLALAGRAVRCPAKVCRINGALVDCATCPLLERDESVLRNRYLSAAYET
jgi:UDP-N-acetylmuramoyl-tripeptide--D-alanyl-D-alanine ligase